MNNAPFSPSVPQRAGWATAVGVAFVVVGSLLSGLGWFLSLFGILNQIGYGIGLGVVIVVLARFKRNGHFPPLRHWPHEAARLKHRVRRPVVVIYTVLLLAALIGGICYGPSNYDALSYRTPQLLHWLDHGGWHWITTPNSRMNIASPGFNWLAAPMIVLLRTDRLSFVVNVLGFALMPGFIFEMLRRAGVAVRVAWWWMWLIPSAYVFATQAGSVGNDLTGAVYAVAAIAFALRARDNGRFSDAALSLLAVAMCTGIKNTNLPILLPWAVALGTSGWRSLVPEQWASVPVFVLAAFASCLPTTILNIRHTGHWTGDPDDEHRVRQPSPWVGAVSNTVALAIANLQPPIWPIAQRTTAAFNRGADRLGSRPLLEQSPRFEIRWYELPSEETAGAGLGLVAMAGISVVGAVLVRKAGPNEHYGDRKRWDLGIASLAALLVPVTLVSSEGLPRLIAVFIPSTLILILLPRVNQRLVSSRFWRFVAVAAACFAVPAVVLSPARPLFPRNLLLTSASKPEAESGVIARARRVYSIYANRPDAFAPLRALLPQGTNKIGIIAFGDEPETSLWRPFGTVSIRHILAAGDLTDERAIAASQPITRSRLGVSVEEFAAAQGFTISGSVELSLRASGTPELWYVLIRKP